MAVVDIADLALGGAITARLRAAGFDTVQDLVANCSRELLQIAGIGPGAVARIEAALAANALMLAVDAWAPHVCTREGEPKRDAALASFWLCDDCTAQFVSIPFDGHEPEWSGSVEQGHCSHCNETKPIRIRQWFLCGVCARVLASIGRGIVAAKYVLDVWNERLSPHMPGVALIETDPPSLQRRTKNAGNTAPRADFTAAIEGKAAVFGIELKSGPGAAGIGGIGAPMSEFQLDVSDCDDIKAVTTELEIPMFLFHVQVRNRPAPPTVEVVPTGMWWVPTRNMSDNLKAVRNRPRETRPAAYFKTTMFRPIASFAEEVTMEYLQTETGKIRAGDRPLLYDLDALT